MKNNILILIISITCLSLLDFFFNLNGLAKSGIFASIWMILIFSFIYSVYYLISDYQFESVYLKYVFCTFILYSIIIVLRGWSFSHADITSILRVPYIFWPFLIPLFIFFDKSLYTIGFLMRCFYYLGLLFLVLAVCVPKLLFSRESAEPIVFTLAIGCEFLLLNAVYLRSKKVNISYLVILWSGISLAYLARRSGLILIVGIIISSYFLNISNKSRSLVKFSPFLFGAAILFSISITNLSRKLTENLTNRMFEDSRSAVFESFFFDMQNHMVFGKGMNARYYCPIGGGKIQDDGVIYEKEYYRDVIENGYLQLILSGGIIHLILFILILLPAAFNGIFKSSNCFSKSCGFIILLWLIYMFGFGLPSLSIGYILVWICVGICYKKSIRDKDDMQIKIELQGLKPSTLINY